MIEPSINAVARLLERTKEGSLPTVIVDIGPATTDIAILDAAIRVTGGLNIGGNTLTLDIAKKLNVPLETAHQFKVLNGLNTGPRQEKITEALKPSLQRIIGEIQKVIRYYTDRFPNESREQTGDCSDFAAYSCCSRKRWASSAAMQPVPALVMAWR